MNGIHLQSVPIGKGIVHWRVVYPHLARRNRHLQREYRELDQACADLKRFLQSNQVEPKTRAMVEEHAPEGEWGAEANAGSAT